MAAAAAAGAWAGGKAWRIIRVNGSVSRSYRERERESGVGEEILVGGFVV